MMQAFLLERYGQDDLTASTIHEPLPAPDEVLVGLDAIAINAIDWKIRNGYFAQTLPMRLPAVLGYEGAGRVLAVGENVTAFSVGDRVAGFFDSGAYAEIATTGQHRLAAIPAGLSFVRAGALPTAAEAAAHLQALLYPAPSSTILVNGAAGGVGGFLVQALVREGHRVVGTASPANHDHLRSLGAEPINYGVGMREEIQRIAPTGFDLAYDVTGYEFIDEVADFIDPHRIVTTTDFAAAEDGAIVMEGNPLRIPLTAATRVALDSAAWGEVRVEIAKTFPFGELPRAMAFVERGHLRGKVIVTNSKDAFSALG